LKDSPIVLRAMSGAWIEIPEEGLRITARKKVAILAYLALGGRSARVICWPG